MFEQVFAVSSEQHGRLQAPMIWASTANTMPASLWTALHLARRAATAPGDATLAAVRRELAAAHAAHAAPGNGDVAALDEMPHLDACISETLRLATASLTVRRVAKPDFSLPASAKSPHRLRLRLGDRVALYPPLLHFDEAAVGPQVADFRPERYLPTKRDGDDETRPSKTPLMPTKPARTT